MVRPIEITDSLSKSEAVQRLQQNQKVQPEAAQQFQKTVTEKLTEKVTTPNPVPKGDQVVLHIDEQEEEKRKHPEGEEIPVPEGEPPEQEQERGKDRNDDDQNPQDHIDIKI